MKKELGYRNRALKDLSRSLFILFHDYELNEQLL